jgi:hypothetical protein
MKTISFFIRLSILSLFVLVSGLASNTLATDVLVSDVEQLYAAVNDPANVGTKVFLFRGTYFLSANDPNGVPRPNGGRLELQEDMSLIGITCYRTSLVGIAGDRSAVVIDAINLPDSSFTGSAIPLGAIRVGRGSNSIECLTVRNSRGLANITTGLLYEGTPHIRIANIDSSRSGYGVALSNHGPSFSGKTLEVDIVNCDLHSNIRGMMGGFRIGNFAGAVGSVVNARLYGNRIYDNQLSLFVNNGPVNSTINAFSSGNRFFNNGVGLGVFGGLNANGNTTNFESHGDRYEDNTGPSNFDKGGLVFSGGESTSTTQANVANNNTVNASLWGARFSGNQLSDLAGFGGRSFFSTTLNPGENNHVTIFLHGMGQQPIVEFFADVLPANPATTNTVTVIR